MYINICIYETVLVVEIMLRPLIVVVVVVIVLITVKVVPM
jgi:hypothetical protein